MLHMHSVCLAKNSARLSAGAGEKTANRSPGATSRVTSRTEQPLWFLAQSLVTLRAFALSLAFFPGLIMVDVWLPVARGRITFSVVSNSAKILLVGSL